MIRENPLIQNFLTLNLPDGSYAIFGSGPMFAYGLKELRDIDLLVKPEVFLDLKTKGTLEKRQFGDQKILFFDGQIEVVDSWGPGKWDVDKLIDEADIVEGIRFVKLSEVLKWKKMMNRPKDAEHIRLIEEYLEKNE